MNAQNELERQTHHAPHYKTTTRHDKKITLGSNKSCDDHAKTQKMRLKFEKYFLHIWSWCTPENWWVLCEYVFLIVRLISLFINATRLMGYYLLVLKVISGICRCNFFFFLRNLWVYMIVWLLLAIRTIANKYPNSGHILVEGLRLLD